MAPTCFSSSPQNSTITAIRNSQCDGTGQYGIDRLVFCQNDRMARGPCLAGQALVISKQCVFTDRRELRKLLAAEAAAEFEPRARPVRHPQFNNASEGLRRDAPARLAEDKHRRFSGSVCDQITGSLR